MILCMKNRCNKKVAPHFFYGDLFLWQLFYGDWEETCLPKTSGPANDKQWVT
tara:strand:- start:875 stop:1030 length:156 start_codon:yes stop_codon:yes gene_type:complete